ncbi:Fungal transcriptional regulatory [Cordyceps militaris]|uniref:Fungal transcriptional regulatory n=1 Tax=Cordyceps militaris TaxID=73501 RepID=A0A2H4SU91_CORMI|nr:Fungal transcriptional regulatory [Cordyceps militaris]
MPGVPSGRACANCRRRRQKCDYAKPTCSRCARLGVACVGSGQRRFLFIDQKCARRPNSGVSSDGSVASTPCSSLQSSLPGPRSEADVLVGCFVDMIQPSTDRRFNLASTYGDFLQNVPQRLGSNTALDVAAQALVASHRDFAVRRPVTPDSLAKYSDAIRALTQSAVEMLRARQSVHITEEFEIGLHTYLHGPVLVQSLFNRTMRLSPTKFEALSRVLAIDKKAPGSSTLVLLFQIPALLQRGRTVMQGVADREAFVTELASTYGALQTSASIVYSKFMTGPSTERKFTGPYGFCLAYSCIFNCMMRAVEPDNSALLSEGETLVRATFDLVPEAQRNRPLGAAHMMLNLSAAWLCASARERPVLYALLGDFGWDFDRDARAVWPLELLEDLLCDVKFKTDPEVVLAQAA